MSLYRESYSTGDLVIFLQSIDWNEVVAIEGEIGIVVEIFDLKDEDIIFDFKVQLATGGFIPVWCGEVKRLENAPHI